MRSIKIHSNVHYFCFSWAIKEEGSAEHLYCTIQKSLSNTAGTQGHEMLKTVLSGWCSY